MKEPTLGDLTQRLNRLEREVRWWRFIGVSMVAVLGLVVLVGATTPKVAEEITAYAFTVLDMEGRTRVRLVVDGGGPAIRLYDAAGTNRGELLLRGDGAPFLTLRDSEGKTTAQVDVSPDGFGGLVLMGSRMGIGAPRREIQLGFTRSESPFLQMLDKDGKVIWTAP